MTSVDVFMTLPKESMRRIRSQACINACMLLRVQAVLAQFAKAFGPHHGLLLKLRDTLLRAAVAAQQWELALRTARELLPTYQLIYKQVGNQYDHCAPRCLR
jgi:hypothetical protein